MKEPKLYELHDTRKIIDKKIVILYGRKYWDITYEDGEEILCRWSKELKKWIVLKFTQDEEKSKKAIEDIRVAMIKALIGGF